MYIYIYVCVCVCLLFVFGAQTQLVGFFRPVNPRPKPGMSKVPQKKFAKWV